VKLERLRANCALIQYTLDIEKDVEEVISTQNVDVIKLIGIKRGYTRRPFI